MEMSLSPLWIQISHDLLGSVFAVAFGDLSPWRRKKEGIDEIKSEAGLLALMIRSQEPAGIAESFPLQAYFTIPILKGVCVFLLEKNISRLASPFLRC